MTQLCLIQGSTPSSFPVRLLKIWQQMVLLPWAGAGRMKVTRWRTGTKDAATGARKEMGVRRWRGTAGWALAEGRSPPAETAGSSPGNTVWGAAQKMEGERSRESQRLQFLVFFIKFSQYLSSETRSFLLPRCLGVGGVKFWGPWESRLYFRQNYRRFVQKSVHLHFPDLPRGKPCQMSQVRAPLQSAGCSLFQD